MLRSATFKLTMYYLLIIAVISIGFSVALYNVATNDLAFGLRSQTQRISTDFPVFLNSPYLRQHGELDQAKRHLVGRLVLFNVLVLAIAGVASYGLARRTLQPIEDNHERQKRFTADVSHELRTPLTALTMESQVALLDSSATKSELRDVIASNIEEAEKLTDLIGNLLKLSKLDATSLAADQPLVLGDVLQAAVDQVQKAAQAHSIRLNYQASAAVQVAGDAAMLTQLFIILLDNAIKYSPADAEVTVTSQTHKDTVVVKVHDSGVGIAKADLEHVFERFYRADAARNNSAANGFGLGLPIAKLIADSHQATISLTSQRGKGTTALILLPKLSVLEQR